RRARQSLQRQLHEGRTRARQPPPLRRHHQNAPDRQRQLGPPSRLQPPHPHRGPDHRPDPRPPPPTPPPRPHPQPPLPPRHRPPPGTTPATRPTPPTSGQRSQEHRRVPRLRQYARHRDRRGAHNLHRHNAQRQRRRRQPRRRRRHRHPAPGHHRRQRLPAQR